MTFDKIRAGRPAAFKERIEANCCQDTQERPLVYLEFLHRHLWTHMVTVFVLTHFDFLNALMLQRKHQL